MTKRRNTRQRTRALNSKKKQISKDESESSEEQVFMQDEDSQQGAQKQSNQGRPTKLVNKQEEDDEDSQENSDSQEDGSEDEDEDSEDEESKPKPEPALRTMQFRSRRGQKMNYLLERKKEEEEDDDDFWKNNKYFGEAKELDKEDDDGEDYVQSSSGKDEFDSDFLSNSNEQAGAEQAQAEGNKADELLEEEENRKRKRKGQELQPKKPSKRVRVRRPEAKEQKQGENSFKYIHEVYTQEQLLAQAAHTEYYNYKSLQKLISLEQERKVYENRYYQVELPKIVWKDSIKGGKHEQTVSMVGYDEDVDFFTAYEQFIAK